ncbi:hypothetical protein CW304_30555 [Bacillus sp. UFRGS-B20]|nr:hypothetical protein CW304_30555 [Bacillus sp. UFRGS-B20]
MPRLPAARWRILRLSPSGVNFFLRSFSRRSELPDLLSADCQVVVPSQCVCALIGRPTERQAGNIKF